VPPAAPPDFLSFLPKSPTLVSAYIKVVLHNVLFVMVNADDRLLPQDGAQNIRQSPGKHIVYFSL